MCAKSRSKASACFRTRLSARLPDRAALGGGIQMTAIRTRAISRPGEGHLGVHSLNHFVISVPDLHEAERFHTAFGLEVENGSEGYAVRTEGHDTDWGYFVEGSRNKQLQHLSFGVFESDLERFK